VKVNHLVNYLSSDILKLYNIKQADRRQSSFPIENDRRSVIDRRSSTRNINPQIIEDIGLIKRTLKLPSQKDKNVDRNVVFSALETIAPVRRFEGVSDNIKDSNYTKAAGLLGLAVVNLPEDTRDLKYAIKEIAGTGIQKCDPKEFQAEFSFIRGTFLESLINKFGKFGAKLHDFDKSLYNTKLGEYLQDKWNINISEMLPTGRVVQQVKLNNNKQAVIKNIEVRACKLEGKTLPKLAGRILLRTPVMGLIVLSALEIPAIIKSFIKPDTAKEKVVKGTSQTIKSAINVATVTAGVGVMGSLLARKGHVGSLLGIGIGAITGMEISHILQNKINNLENKIIG